MPAETVGILKGVGHFTLWFLVGHLLFWLTKTAKPKDMRIQLWGPFLPFALASLAAVPYLLQVTGLISREAALHPGFVVFMLYPLTDHAVWAKWVFGHFHLNVVMLAVAYIHLVMHYIALVKKLKASK